MRQINDALLINIGAGLDLYKICRVIAITEDGRCVLDNEGSIYVESVQYEAAYVGYFIEEYSGIIGGLFGSPKWRFIANDIYYRSSS